MRLGYALANETYFASLEHTAKQKYLKKSLKKLKDSDWKWIITGTKNPEKQEKELKKLKIPE